MFSNTISDVDTIVPKPVDGGWKSTEPSALVKLEPVKSAEPPMNSESYRARH